MTTTPTPAPEVEALIERLENARSEIVYAANRLDDQAVSDAAHVVAEAETFIRSQASRIKELEAERDEADVGAFDSAVRAGKSELRARKAEARVERLRGALEPFAEFGRNNTDDDGWGGLRCERERISVWFGPSDFRTARAAYEETQDGE